MNKITVQGVPIAKKRPKFARRGKFVTTYNEQETEEGKFLLLALKQIPKKPIIDPMRIVMYFCFPRPQGHYGTGKNVGRLKASAPYHHTVKPDIDNCIKFVLDCLNEQLFKDDKQIVDIAAKKRYSDDPRTEILWEVLS